METILITGGTGLVGTTLSTMLADKGYQVIILTRHLPGNTGSQPNIGYALWDVKKGSIDRTAIQKADHIVHLAGAGVVDKRWNDSYKKEILESRTQSSALIIDALRQEENKVQTVVSASAIGWYGPDSDTTPAAGFEETAPGARDFLGTTCKRWEESVDPATALGKRVVKIRTGIVLSNAGGALAEFKKPLRIGVAAILGNGKQVVSWIHIDDLCRIYLTAIQNKQLQGAYNAVAPAPVSNKQLTLQLARIVKGNFFIPVHVPAFVLKMVMGESSIEVLKSCTVNCEKIKRTGFTFLYPSIDAALQEINS